MASITIKEIDATTALVDGISDVVYVPGFVSIDDNSPKSVLNGEYAIKSPVLCRTISEFEYYFGSKPFMFTGSSGQKMDNSYYYAKQLIAMGLPVLYHACNVEVGSVQKDVYTLLTEEPVDWSTNYSSYYTKDHVAVAGIDVTPEDADEGSHVYEAPRFKMMTYYMKETVNLLKNVSSMTSSSSLFTSPSGDSKIVTMLEELKDIGEYGQVKFVTSGAYGIVGVSSSDSSLTGLEIAQKMIEVVVARGGDAVALIDHENDGGEVLVGSGSVYEAIKNQNIGNSEYAAMFTPWATYSISTSPVRVHMPASFGYLMSYAISAQVNPTFLAIAGGARGQVPGIIKLDTSSRLSNTIANEYQPRDGVSINAITDFKPYGLTIMGNRTLKDNSYQGNLTATSFLDVRNMASDIKKQAFVTAKKLLFEKNSDTLWVRFLAGITPLLDSMRSGQGIKDYTISKVTTNEKAKLKALINIVPIYSVEDFEITVQMSDDDVEIS